MSQHTPGPYRIIHTADDRTFIDADVEDTVAEVNRRLPEDEDNAEFIVRACNSYEALLAALETIRTGLADDRAYRDCARAALAKIDGRA